MIDLIATDEKMDLNIETGGVGTIGVGQAVLKVSCQLLLSAGQSTDLILKVAPVFAHLDVQQLKCPVLQLFII